MFSVMKWTYYYKFRYFPLRTKLPNDLIRPGVKSSYQNHSNSKVIQKFRHCSQLAVPWWEVYLSGLKDFMWSGVDLPSQWSYLQVLCFPHAWYISLMRQLFKFDCFYPSSETTLSSYNLHHLDASISWTVR